MSNENNILRPQQGPQSCFVNLWAGIAGEPERDCDFPLVFYGGELRPVTR
jgi:hypothetical protein